MSKNLNTYRTQKSKKSKEGQIKNLRKLISNINLKNKTVKQLILVSLSTCFSSSIYLLTSKILDNYFSDVTANGLGLILDKTLDFLFQSKIFLKQINLKRYDLIIKFIISKVITTAVSQLLFIIYIKYLKQFKKFELDNTIVRIIISTSVFFFLVFPLSKYFVFT